MLQNPLIDFSLSIEEWLGFFRQLFNIINETVQKLFGKPLFEDQSAAPAESTTEG